MTDYKLVPIGPTPEMVEAAESAYMPFGDMEMAIRMAVLAAPALQGEPVAAEIELLKEQLNAMTEYKVAAHQLIGIPASVGISEPIEGFAKRPQDIMPAVRDMALRIELLERQAAEREWQLAESRANDKQAMAYLNEVRAIVGGDDFPDMVRRCEKLRAECEKLRAAMIEAKGHISHYMYGGSSYREPAVAAIALIDGALQEANP